MYNVDGFNERTMFIKNSNNRRVLNTNKKMNNMTNFNSSFAKMKISENKPDIETAKREDQNYIDQVRGNKDNFVLQNYNLNHFSDLKEQNSVSDALNRNRFKKF